MRMFAAHHTGIRLHRKRRHAATLKNLHVRVVHFLITDRCRFIGYIEAVRVFHNELARAHQPKTRANFIPKLGLNLVKIDGGLSIRLQLRRGQRGDDLLVRRAKQPFAVFAIAHFKEDICRLLVSAAGLPDFRRLHGRHQYFQRARAIHFLADDGFDLSQNPNARRQKRVQPTG